MIDWLIDWLIDCLIDWNNSSNIKRKLLIKYKENSQFRLRF